MNRRHIIRAGIGIALMAASLSPALHSAGGQQLKSPPTPVYTYQVVHTYPHDPTAFTQGLIYLDGDLYESTGLNGRSSIRRVKLETGKVLQQQPVSADYFAEGLVNWDSELIQLTWQNQMGFVYDRKSFALKRKFSYP